MAYRGFTWNLTYSEAANVRRILAAHLHCDDPRRWDVEVATHLIAKINWYLEVTPDGATPAHGPADA